MAQPSRRPQPLTVDGFDAISAELRQLATEAEAVANLWRDGGPDSIPLERLQSTVDGLHFARTVVTKARQALARRRLEAALDSK